MRKIFSLFAALTLSVGLWAANSVITFTSTSELYPGEFYDQMTKMNVFNPNAFLDANDQVLPIVEGGVTYDDATKTGTITFAGELVTLYGSDYGDVVAFMNCSSLTSITLPEGLTSLGRASFALCSSLASVTLPESLTTIGDNVFQGCSSLASITIPANVTEIGYGAFMDCSGLTDFYVAWTTMLPTLGNIVFGDASIGTATLHVPAGSLALYQNADQWKDFGSIVEYVPQDIKDAAIAAVNAEIAETDNDNVKAIATDAA
ncbi:MAG: leucine-rich repeat domain-containing protein, partial [Paludibacteraceae bacterium]|nr:leucine-rich repeat domain-containing protein [Paludibacteraceae bacterium]